MDHSVKRRIAVLLAMAAIAFTFFERTPGSETVRAVQILLLFVSGVSAGVALTLFRISRRS